MYKYFHLVVLPAVLQIVVGGTSAAWALNRAVLVGVTEYQNDLISDLQFCVNDVVNLKLALVASGFHADDIALLHSEAYGDALPPSRQNVLQAIEKTMAACQKDDLVVFAFSGHGFRIGDSDYLGSQEADIAHPAETMIPVSTIIQQFNKSQAGKKMAFLDACRNDPLMRDQPAANFRGEALGNDTIVFSSCRPEEQSYEIPEFKHGLFMHAVIRGLTYADANKDSQIDVLELCSYVDAEMHDATKRWLQGKPQNLILMSHYSNFSLFQRVAAQENPVPLYALDDEESVSPIELKFLELTERIFVEGKNRDTVQALEDYLDVAQNVSLVRQAKEKLARAYLALDIKKNLNKALTLNQEAGNQELVLELMQDTAVMDGKTQIAGVKEGDQLAVADVTTFKDNDWCRVVAIDGERLAKSGGYVLKKYFTASAPKTTSTAAPPTRKYVPSGYGHGTGYVNASVGLSNQDRAEFIRSVPDYQRVPMMSDLLREQVGFIRSPEFRQVAQLELQADRSYRQADSLYDRGRPVQGFFKELEGLQREFDAERRFQQFQNQQPFWRQQGPRGAEQGWGGDRNWGGNQGWGGGGGRGGGGGWDRGGGGGRSGGRGRE